MDLRIRVDREHFEYLRVQKGSLDKFAHDFQHWHRLYEEDLRNTYEQISAFLPSQCAEVLDVGSGLGGIDVLLLRHYAALDQATRLTLLDGHDDDARVKLHRLTFNNMRVARNFHWKNGTPITMLDTVRTDVQKFEREADLVVSFGAWCFHVEPMIYLPQILGSGSHKNTVFILDVRRDKRSYMTDLLRHLELKAVAAEREKWQRCIFHVRKT